MKNEKRLAFSFFMCIILIIMMLSSCADADIVISHGERHHTTAVDTAEYICVTVNISSGKFHLDENCRHAVKIKNENKKTLLYSNVSAAIDDGYSPCSVCAAEYKN